MSPRCYSYVRFSSEKQRHGSSLDRQIEAATRYAHNHSLVLDTSTYKDLGVSAFRSKNAESALGAFIEAVDSKRIPRGSYLLIESLDRLSRDKVPTALRLLLSLTEKGITIVTLMDEQVFSEANITENWTKLVVACAIMARANEESVTKSKRAHDAINRRVDKGQLPTTRLPTWMKFTKDRTAATLIPARAKVVKRIFDDVILGISAREIARALNKEKVPVLFYATEWRQSALSQLLRNPAVYGEFKGEIRLPMVVTKARFLKAQRVIKDRTLYKGGFSRSNPNNSLVGLSKCGHCGRVMRFLPRTDGSFYIRCVGATDGGVCDGRLFPFVACETALVTHLTLLETNEGLSKSIYTEKYEESQTLEGEIEVLKERQERLVKLAEETGDVAVLAARLKRLQSEIGALESKRKTLGVHGEESNFDSVGIFSDYSVFVHGGYDEYKPLTSATNIIEIRRLLKMAFVRVLKKIEFLNAEKKKWQPTLQLTYVNDRTATVDVVPFLSERTQKWIKNGTYGRSDIKRRR